MTHLNELILAQEDPFDYIYEGLAFTHGQELYDYLSEMYAQVVIDSGMHPDADFENIISMMFSNIEEDC